MTEEEYNSMSAKEQEDYENYLRPTDKEIAELDAYYNLFGGYLREYVEVKEKEENWLSKWNLTQSLEKTLEWNKGTKNGISAKDICERQFLMYLNKK